MPPRPRSPVARLTRTPPPLPASGAFIFQGGILMNLGCVLEWILGNTFPAVVFGVYGNFWLAFAASLSPSYGAYAFYAPLDARTPLAGLRSTGFNASFGESRRPSPLGRGRPADG